VNNVVIIINSPEESHERESSETEAFRTVIKNSDYYTLTQKICGGGKKEKARIKMLKNKLREEINTVVIFIISKAFRLLHFCCRLTP
jgi:hypothetical protein